MKQMINIRRERIEDYKDISELIQSAFKLDTYSDHSEQILVEELRKIDNYIPELSLVAEIENQIVGYIMFSKLGIGSQVELALAPLAVSPEYQKIGVGSKLIETGHKIADNLGYQFILVLGNPIYYSKFGYNSIKQTKIISPFPEELNEYYQIKRLKNNAEIPSGKIKYAKPFNIQY